MTQAEKTLEALERENFKLRQENKKLETDNARLTKDLEKAEFGKLTLEAKVKALSDHLAQAEKNQNLLIQQLELVNALNSEPHKGV